jgi:cytoskeletal protein RodZ
MPDTQSKIAEMLKTQRRKLGLSIDQIFERTRINPEFLNALETGDFDVLPKAYVRMFLKTYARELGLDPEGILSEYEKTVAPPREIPTTPPPSHRKSNMAPVMLLAIGLIIVVMIALNVGEQNEITVPLDATTTAPRIQTSVELAPQPTAPPQISRVETTTQVETRPTAPNQSLAEAPTIEIAEQTTTPVENDSTTIQPAIPDDIEISLSETPEPPQLPETNTWPQTQPPEPIVLTSYALPMPVVLADEEIMTLSGFVKETTHLAVSADGRQLFSGIIQAGSQRRWQAHDRFQLQVERAGAIALSLQDQPLESASPPDRSLRLVVSRTLIRVEELDNTPSDR